MILTVAGLLRNVDDSRQDGAAPSGAGCSEGADNEVAINASGRRRFAPTLYHVHRQRVKPNVL